MSSDVTVSGSGLSADTASSSASTQRSRHDVNFDLTSSPSTQGSESDLGSSFSRNTKSLPSMDSQSTQTTDFGEHTDDDPSTGSAMLNQVTAYNAAQQLQPNVALLKFLADEVKKHLDPARPVLTTPAQLPFMRPPQPSMIDPTLRLQQAPTLTMDHVPMASLPQSTAKKPSAPKAHSGVAKGSSGRTGSRGGTRTLVVKLKLPKRGRNKKVYDMMIAAEKSKKRKFQEEEGDDDEEFVVGRVTEQKLKAQSSIAMRPVRSTRQKDASAAIKRQKELEKAVKAIEADAEEQVKRYWGTSKKRAPARTGRTASKPAPVPDQPADHNAPMSRPMRNTKAGTKVSPSDRAPKPALARRGRPAKGATGNKKTQVNRVGIRKNQTAAVAKSRAGAVDSPDVSMQDVDEDIAAPSPESSDLSSVSSFANSSSASSHPSPEPAEGHLIDEAEKLDLIEGTAVQMADVQHPMQDMRLSDNASQMIIYNPASAPISTAQAVQTSSRKRNGKGTRQSNTSARRNDAQISRFAIGFGHNGPVGPVDLDAQQQPPVATFDTRLTLTHNQSWIGADMAKDMSYGGPVQGFMHIAGQDRSSLNAPQNMGEFEGPERFQLPRIEPQVVGKPPVWAFKRQQLCETLPYYNAYQSGVYMNGGIIYAMLIDAESRPNDVFNPEIIITRCGGGRGGVDANGHRAQATHQDASPIGLAFERAKVNKLPIIVIAGANYRNSEHRGDFLPHRYNVLAHFHVTDVWLELNDNYRTFCCRMEKILLQEQSWWASEPYIPSIYGLYAPIYTCRRCQAGSKCQFAQGWVCLNVNCPSYFKLVDEATGFEGELTELVYSAPFICERTPYNGNGALPPLVPRLLTEQDMIFHARSGTEEIFTKGIVCPKCRCCSRRKDFKKWTCENSDVCNFTYELPVRTLTPLQAQPVLLSEQDGRYPFCRSLTRRSMPIGHFNVDEFEITGEGGQIVGYVRHFKSNELVNALEDGPDDLFREMQEKDFGLMRRPVRQTGCAGEILTSHYASNWGAPYKFVVSQMSKPFTAAPEVIVKALKKMTWAGARSLSDGGPAFQPFNELLSIGYMENTRIGYHDDGEKELGPTIATLSLGSQAEMSLRPKRRAPEGIGRTLNNQRGTKAEVLKILLSHGDIVIMHGEGVQKYYEHAVTPRGTLRYALTCRTILPERLSDDAERAEAARLAQLPDGHEAWDYNGDELLVETEEQKAKKKSLQMVSALQRTLDDLRSMVQHSSPEELSQIAGIEEVIGAYRTAIGNAAPASSSETDGDPTTSSAEDTSAAEDTSTGEDTDYVMLNPGQSDSVAESSEDEQLVEDELVDAVNDLAVSSQTSQSSS